MPDRQTMRNLTSVVPAGMELIHQNHEVNVVSRLAEMNHFVGDDVFQHSRGFFSRWVFSRMLPASALQLSHLAFTR